jgi:predicted ATP-grasp superfamily ATP-dependent carboligase
LANINFKKDERDGQLYFFELNPRMSVWIGLDIACGIDIPYYYYKTCLGERIVPKEEYLIGKTWLRLYEDIRGIRPLIKDGSLTWHQWILSVIKTDSGALYTLEDPLPAVSQIFNIFKELTKRVNDMQNWRI